MAKHDQTKFAISTGQIAIAIHLLSLTSTAAVDVARIWLDILEIFLPSDQGFERIEAQPAHGCILMKVQRMRHPHWAAIDGNVAGNPFFTVDCRPYNTVGYDLLTKSLVESDQDDISSRYGVICSGVHAVSLEDVLVSSRLTKTGSANPTKASGRDATEAWLRHIRTVCDGRTSLF